MGAVRQWLLPSSDMFGNWLWKARNSRAEFWLSHAEGITVDEGAARCTESRQVRQERRELEIAKTEYFTAFDGESYLVSPTRCYCRAHGVRQIQLMRRRLDRGLNGAYDVLCLFAVGGCVNVPSFLQDKVRRK